MSKLSDLLQQAAVIRDATEEHENTAVRVGTMFVDFIQSCLDVLPPEIVNATGISTSTSKTNFVVHYSTVNDDGESVSKVISIPAATTERAGLLSATKLLQLDQAVKQAALIAETAIASVSFSQSGDECILQLLPVSGGNSVSYPIPKATSIRTGVLSGADFAAFAGKLDVVVGEFDAELTPSAYGGDDSRPCLFVSDTDSTVAIWDSDKGRWVPLLGCLGHWDVTALVNRARTTGDVDSDEVEALGAAITSGKLVTYNTKPCIAWNGSGGDVFLLTADGALVTLVAQDGRASYEARWLERVTALEARLSALETRVDSLFAEDPIDEPVDEITQGNTGDDSSQTEMPAPTNS